LENNPQRMSRKRVLIITYYWPPSGGSGVQRWVKFSKYLREFGWEPVIYTPENPEPPALDPGLSKDVPDNLEIIKTRIWEPYSIYKKFIGADKDMRIGAGFLSEESKPKLTETLSVWIRGNLFIPDAKRYWIRPSARFLANYLHDHPVDVIVSTGPPHSMHIIARGVHRKLKIPWLADFRDPWTDIDFYEDLKLSRWADRKHHQLETSVLNEADRVTLVSPTWRDDFQSQTKTKVDLLTNGYDDDDFSAAQPEPGPGFTISHIGSIPPSRNPEVLWNAISELKDEEPELTQELKVRLVGSVDISVFNSVREKKIEDCVDKIDYIPHDEVILEQYRASVLLMIVNRSKNAKGILPGKFFEYIAARRPILCIGPEESDIAIIIREKKLGYLVKYEDVHSMKSVLRKLYTAHKSDKLGIASTSASEYSRKSLTEQLSHILDELSAK